MPVRPLSAMYGTGGIDPYMGGGMQRGGGGRVIGDPMGGMIPGQSQGNGGFYPPNLLHGDPMGSLGRGGGMMGGAQGQNGIGSGAMPANRNNVTMPRYAQRPNNYGMPEMSGGGTGEEKFGQLSGAGSMNPIQSGGSGLPLGMGGPMSGGLPLGMGGPMSGMPSMGGGQNPPGAQFPMGIVEPDKYGNFRTPSSQMPQFGGMPMDVLGSLQGSMAQLGGAQGMPTQTPNAGSLQSMYGRRSYF